MRVWLDDERPMPDGYDVHVRTASEAIALLETGQVTRISLDHDLGPPEAGTGYDVAKWIEEAAFRGRIPPMRFAVHTANPVGRSNMVDCLQNADRFWGDRETPHEFVVAFEDGRTLDDLADALSRAGCAGAALSQQEGRWRLRFARKSGTFDHAFEQAIAEIRAAGVEGSMAVLKDHVRPSGTIRDAFWRTA